MEEYILNEESGSRQPFRFIDVNQPTQAERVRDPFGSSDAYCGVCVVEGKGSVRGAT